jgi:hypothetical protein
MIVAGHYTGIQWLRIKQKGIVYKENIQNQHRLPSLPENGIVGYNFDRKAAIPARTAKGKLKDTQLSQ